MVYHYDTPDGCVCMQTKQFTHNENTLQLLCCFFASGQWLLPLCVYSSKRGETSSTQTALRNTYLYVCNMVGP